MSPYGNIQKYRIVERIARGGMGVVYLAEDNLGRSVAIKVLHQSIQDDESRERFEREARAAGGLSHPNIVTIYEFGEHEDQPFIAMEYVSGETLAQIIKRSAPVPLVRKLQYIEDLCAGLAYAHKAGVVHRDVKPANVIIKDQTYLKILDFGIARVAQSSMTQAGLIMGTPSYMAPEQALGRPTDHRADVFAVGLVMYELLSFRQAYPGDTAHGVIHRIIHDQAEPLATLCPDLDPGLCAIVAKAIEKDPASRYQDLGTMRSEIARIRQRLEHLQEEATVLVPKIAGLPAQSSSSATPGSSSRQTHQELRERRAKQIEVHLAEAHRQLEAGHLEAALEACHQAGALDPDDSRTLDILDRVRSAIDAQRVRHNLAEARKHLQQDNLTAADERLAEALRLNPQSTDASALRREIEQRQREQERALERSRGSRAALDRARTSLNQGALESAIRLSDEALSLDPDSRDAQEIRSQALGALEERRRTSEHEQRAVEVADEARRLFGEGSHHAALQLLAEFSPGHDVVTRALAELRGELEAIEESRRLEEAGRVHREQQERQRKEAERLEREQWARSQLTAAQRAIDQELFDDALAVLQRLREVDPSNPGVSRLVDVATRGQSDARAAHERGLAAEEHVVAASQCLARGELGAAGAHIDAAIDLVPEHEGAKRLRRVLLHGPAADEPLPSETDSPTGFARTFRPLAIAAASIAVLAVAGALWWALRPGKRPATTATVARPSEGRAVESREGNAVELRVAAAKTALRTYLDAGDFRAAARELASALSLKSDDQELGALENRIFEAVISRARSATEGAKGQGAGQQLALADQRLQRASELRTSRQIETAVGEYLEVESILANPTPGVPAVTAEARRLLAARNLNGAMAKVREGLAVTPGDESLLAAQSDVVKMAASRTLEVRRGAERAGATAQVSYKQAVSKEQNAGALRSAGKIDPAFDEYVAAESLFRSSMTTVAGELAIEGRVRGSIAAGNLLEAFREADSALKRNAADIRAQSLVAQVVTAAASAAETARARASAEQAAAEPSFAQADARLQAASRARTEGRPEQAVRDYMASEKLFLEAIPAVATVRTIDARVARGVQLLKEGRLPEAATEASASLAIRSGHEGARGLHAKVLAAARDRAAGAHEKASKANTSNLPAFQEATARERQAASLKNPAELESAVRDYLDAERQFLALAAPVAIPPTVPTGGRAAATAAAREVDQALRRYAAAYGKMAVADLRAVFPKASKRRLDGMAKNRSACRAYQVTFGEPKIELVPDGRILVDVATSYECTPRAGGGVLPFTVTEQMTLGAQPGGGFVILNIAEP